MLEHLGRRLKLNVARAAQTTALSAMAGISMAIGLGFLTVATWFYITSVASPTVAALTLGAAYFALGLIVLAITAVRQREARIREEKIATETAADVDMVGLVSAFMTGLAAGSKARS